MLIFDTLDELESYEKLIPGFVSVIDVLDHSKPYDDGPGKYSTGGKNPKRYVIDAYVSSRDGFAAPKSEGLVLEICLEGEEIINASGSVFRMAPGRFLIYDGGLEAKRGVMYSTPQAFKAVRFFL